MEVKIRKRNYTTLRQVKQGSSYPSTPKKERSANNIVMVEKVERSSTTEIHRKQRKTLSSRFNNSIVKEKECGESINSLRLSLSSVTRTNIWGVSLRSLPIVSVNQKNSIENLKIPIIIHEIIESIKEKGGKKGKSKKKYKNNNYFK